MFFISHEPMIFLTSTRICCKTNVIVINKILIKRREIEKSDIYDVVGANDIDKLSF